LAYQPSPNFGFIEKLRDTHSGFVTRTARRFEGQTVKISRDFHDSHVQDRLLKVYLTLHSTNVSLPTGTELQTKRSTGMDFTLNVGCAHSTT
jgi:hypothetical protein